jgi:hypothetical protein
MILYIISSGLIVALPVCLIDIFFFEKVNVAQRSSFERRLGWLGLFVCVALAFKFSEFMCNAFSITVRTDIDFVNLIWAIAFGVTTAVCGFKRHDEH